MKVLQVKIPLSNLKEILIRDRVHRTDYGLPEDCEIQRAWMDQESNQLCIVFTDHRSVEDIFREINSDHLIPMGVELAPGAIPPMIPCPKFERIIFGPGKNATED